MKILELVFWLIQYGVLAFYAWFYLLGLITVPPGTVICQQTWVVTWGDYASILGFFILPPIAIWSLAKKHAEWETKRQGVV